MRTGHVVIGANYGDEGKGLLTDYFVRKHKSVTNVRFNGGAQAGHTVVRDGRRHVFGHVGAGTFAGSCTHLSSRFLVNPIMLDKELRILKTMGFEPYMTIDPRARVSTLYDMALNSIAEVARGGKRHGSCGMGINETVTRHAAGYRLTVADLMNKTMLRDKLERITAQWVPLRLEQLIGGQTVPLAELAPYFEALKLKAWRATDLLQDHMQSVVDGLGELAPMSENCHVTFEGAQGLMLDEFMGEFPHVTRSMTGLPYAIEAAGDLGVEELQPVYVTRSYLTRHGAGPLAHEGDQFIAYGSDIVDTTNVTNQWQGHLRFAPLNVDALAQFIKVDLDRASVVAQMQNVTLKPAQLALTWVDVFEKRDPSDVVVVKNNKLMQFHIDELPNFLEFATGLPVTFISRGPEAKDITEV